MWPLAEDVEYHAEKCQAEYGPIPLWGYRFTREWRAFPPLKVLSPDTMTMNLILDLMGL
jgi:hypothetical protein